MRFKQIFLSIAALFIASHSWSAVGTSVIDGTKEDSEIQGQLKFEDTPKGLHIMGAIENVPSGEHGFHIHEFGDCSNEGMNAGGHFNPDQHPHGHLMKDGLAHAHAGDMGNLTADEKGSTSVDVILPGISLNGGKYAVAGRAVIVHEKKDDFGQPTGNAGGRIACGPIVLTGK